jgi:hypothetical protein
MSENIVKALNVQKHIRMRKRSEFIVFRGRDVTEYKKRKCSVIYVYEENIEFQFLSFFNTLRCISY